MVATSGAGEVLNRPVDQGLTVPSQGPCCKEVGRQMEIPEEAEPVVVVTGAAAAGLTPPQVQVAAAVQVIIIQAMYLQRH